MKPRHLRIHKLEDSKTEILKDLLPEAVGLGRQNEVDAPCVGLSTLPSG